MERIKRYLETLYNQVIKNDYDAIVLFIGDEGAGKSTLMLQTTWLWQQIAQGEATVDSVLDRVVHDDRRKFRQQLARSEKQRAQLAMDAAHILHKKDAMVSEQKEVEKSLLDIRTLSYFIQLGYQDWDDVADKLQRQRARHVFRIPRRGVVWGYSRDSVDKRYVDGEWPDEPDFKDTFPDLEGTKLWAEFNRRDEERKRERLETVDEPKPDDIRWQEQAKVAIRATKPWDDDKGMTYKDAAKLIDYSYGWVGDRVDDWKEGKLDHLFEDEGEEFAGGEQAAAAGL